MLAIKKIKYAMLGNNTKRTDMLYNASQLLFTIAPKLIVSSEAHDIQLKKLMVYLAIISYN